MNKEEQKCLSVLIAGRLYERRHVSKRLPLHSLGTLTCWRVSYTVDLFA
jgi:hypothetical protein